MGAKNSTSKKSKKNLEPEEPIGEGASKIVRTHVLWSMGAGLIPVPLFDIAAVTAIQMDALSQLAKHEDVDYSEDAGKKFVAGLTGGTLARIGASLFKSVPGVGALAGGAAMSAMSAASTYAVCQVALHHFRKHGNFLAPEVDLEFEETRKQYRKALAKGREFVKSLKARAESPEAREVFVHLDQIRDLREAEVLTEREFEAKKKKLLKRLD